MLLFKMAEIKMTKTEINKLIEALDLNGDGMIDFGYISFLWFFLLILAWVLFYNFFLQCQLVLTK